MVVRRLLAAWPVPLVLCAAAANAQNIQVVGPVDGGVAAAPAPANIPRFEVMPDPSDPGRPRRNGLIAAYQVRENMTVGIGRFAIPEIARPRTNMERERDPTGVRRRERGMAAVGVSIRFR